MHTKHQQWASIDPQLTFGWDRPDSLTSFVGEDPAARLEALLSEALDDTFPASDPISSLRFD